MRAGGWDGRACEGGPLVGQPTCHREVTTMRVGLLRCSRGRDHSLAAARIRLATAAELALLRAQFRLVQHIARAGLR